MTAVHLRHDDDKADAHGASAAIPAPSDPLAHELARCRAIVMASKDDADCEAAWAENRRRFFTYWPSPDHSNTPTAANPNDAAPKSEGN
jgi:conjugative transfer region protein TrbK